MRTITVTIAPDGDTTVQVDGVAGPSCKDVTARLEAALGTVASTAPTDAMYQPVADEHATELES